MLLFLTCEDKKKERNGFGSLSVKIKFEHQVADAPVNDSDEVIKDSELISDSLKQIIKEATQKFKDEELDLDENDKTDTLIPTKKEKIKLSSSIKYVKITVGELDPVELTVSGSTASTTINDIPVGPQVVKVELSNPDKVVLYHQTQTVTIENGETATPSFNKFTTSNETIEIKKLDSDFWDSMEDDVSS